MSCISVPNCRTRLLRLWFIMTNPEWVSYDITNKILKVDHLLLKLKVAVLVNALLRTFSMLLLRSALLRSLIIIFVMDVVIDCEWIDLTSCKVSVKWLCLSVCIVLLTWGLSTYVRLPFCVVYLSTELSFVLCLCLELIGTFWISSVFRLMNFSVWVLL